MFNAYLQSTNQYQLQIFQFSVWQDTIKPVLKLLSGQPRTQFSTTPDAKTLKERNFVETTFTKPEEPLGNPSFLMICPSRQVMVLWDCQIHEELMAEAEFYQE